MNEKIRNISKKILSDNWYVLHKYIFEYKNKNNEWQLQEREAYDRGNGATILLYNRAKKTVVLTKQFRLPTYINGNATGLLIEACAGLLERDNEADCIVREAHEETGYRIDKLQKIFEAYMSPGSVTELLHFFIAEYTENDKTGEGGGLASEQENIEVLELDFATAYAMIAAGDIVDGKTIMLLQYAKINNLIQ